MNYSIFIERHKAIFLMDQLKKKGYRVAPASQSAKGCFILPFTTEVSYGPNPPREERRGKGLFVVYESDGSYAAKPAAMAREIAALIKTYFCIECEVVKG